MAQPAEDQELPKVTRVYQNHHLNSTRWDSFSPRDDDIVVCTSLKSGTTWMCNVLAHLLNRDKEVTDATSRGEWVDARFFCSIDDLTKAVEERTVRRHFKSHLPLDGLKYFPQVKYIILGRDPRDVFMSFYNHYWNYTENMIELLNSDCFDQKRHGPTLAPCPEDIHEVWKSWITKGSWEQDSEGFPFWPNMWHTESFWRFKHLPNFMFLHYADMLADEHAMVRKVAKFLGEELDDAAVDKIVQATTFQKVKKDATAKDAAQGAGAKYLFKDGNAMFTNKGSNGRWRSVLTKEELEMYEATKVKVLSPACAKWLENGGEV